MSQHILICRPNDGAGWKMIEEHGGRFGTVAAGAGISVAGLVLGMVETLRKNGSCLVTFSTQREEAVFPILAEQGDLAYWAPGALISVFALERSEVSDLWNRADRLPDFPTGHITAEGKSKRCRSPLLPDAVLDWFRKEQGLSSFDAPSPWQEMMERQHPVSRPKWPRILVVRPHWRILELVPSAFDSPEEEARRAAARDAAAAHDLARRKAAEPGEQTKRKQELQAIERQRFSLTDEQKVEFDRAWKKQFGGNWGEAPVTPFVRE